MARNGGVSGRRHAERGVHDRRSSKPFEHESYAELSEWTVDDIFGQFASVTYLLAPSAPLARGQTLAGQSMRTVD